eukprot:COSAG06_NODE_55741_length_288_cov_0.814815_1_plen_56_part_10
MGARTALDLLLLGLLALLLCTLAFQISVLNLLRARSAQLRLSLACCPRLARFVDQT